MSRTRLVLFSCLLPMNFLCAYNFDTFTHFMLVVLITQSWSVEAEQDLDSVFQLNYNCV